MSYNASIAAPRKLTEAENTQLREALQEQLPKSPDTLEDVVDLIDYTLAMISNGKTVEYVIQELLSMDMEILPESSGAGLGKTLSEQLSELFGVDQKQDGNEHPDAVDDTAVGTNDDGASPRVASLKPVIAENNALTMSGALGSSRKGAKKDADSKSKKDSTNKKQDDRKEGRGRRNERRDDRGRGQDDRRNNDKHQQRKDRGDDRGRDRREDRRGRGGRSTPSEAFERLSGGRGHRGDHRDGGGRRGDDARWQRGGPGPGRGGGRDDRGGRGGRNARGGGGRGGDPGGRSGRGGRDGRGPPRRENDRGGRGAPMTGKRRDRDDEDDFIPANSGYGRGGRGAGRGGGRGRVGPEGKRQRVDESAEWQNDGYGEESYDEPYGGGHDGGYYDYSPWRGGYRGGRGGRGRGSRGRGRGRGGRAFESPEGGPDGQEVTPSAADGQEGEGGYDADAAAHPSPIVSASYGGRGYRGRGGRSYRGRGRGRGGYRAQVASMLASKTWVRPKTDVEAGKGDDNGGADGGGGDAPES